ncbi:MAG: MliC family protein [Mesonia sp.]|uniref:MliC family protein n=1 Tax=Mesonia sp. TaxID=1960830 RepID=UPI003F9E9D98
MKKIILSALVCGLSFTACKNQTDQKDIEDKQTTPAKEVQVDNNAQLERDTPTPDHLYKSDKGEILEVHFLKEDKENILKIKRDGHPEIVLKKTLKEANGVIYENKNYSWKQQKDHIIFSDGKESMNLTLISPLEYEFTNGDVDMTVIYFSKEDKRFVSLKKEKQSKITLKQTTSWAKGAEYGKGDVKWRSQGDTGILTENGEKTTFKQKNN